MGRNGSKTYYINSGYAITFMREEESKDLYPVLVSEDNKKPLQNLIFSPTGEPIFSAAGTVTIDGQNYNCHVTRTKDEMYVSTSYYRFNISIVYNGENEDGSSNSTYQVIDMKFIRTLPSYDYLCYYFILYLFMGPNYANNFTNTIGEISLICEYNEVGEQVNNYAVGKFGESSLMHDSEGNIVSISSVIHMPILVRKLVSS